MKRLFSTTLIVALFSMLPQAQAQISTLTTTFTLRSFKALPSQTVMIQTSSNASGGEITVATGTSLQKGSSSFKRQRSFRRRVVGSGTSAQLNISVLIDKTSRKLDQGNTHESSTSNGPLIGQTVQGMRDAFGRWRLALKGKVATRAQTLQITGLEAYENRQWFPKHAVRIGETWNIEPSFLRHFLQKEMGPVAIDATLTFDSVKIIDAEPTAVLTFKIKSRAINEDAYSRISSARFDLQGHLYVSLVTMLDKKLMLSGIISVTSQTNGTTTIATNPVTYIVTKSLR